jgi:murein DD-endopeptidase MepM/ murein hydrolase activator NlpD
MADDRRMTFIVVPHAGTRDLTTRTYEISYRTLRRWVIAGGVVLLLILLMAASWFFLAAQAARASLLQSQVTRLQGQVAQTDELRRALEQLEAQKRQIDAILSEGMHGRHDSVPAAPPPAQREEDDSTQASLPRGWPLAAKGFVTQEPDLPTTDGHTGLDVAVTTGTRILAAASGVVEDAGEDPVYGRYVRISHPGGYETLYGHASRVLVKAHQRVRERQAIALSGSTGLSTGPHLHFEVRKHGVPVDPRTLVLTPE